MANCQWRGLISSHLQALDSVICCKLHFAVIGKPFFYKPQSLQERLEQPLSITNLTRKSQSPLIGGQNPREKTAKSDRRSDRSLCCRVLSRAWLMDAPVWPLITANVFWALFLHHVLLSIPSSDSLRQVLVFCFHKVYETQGSSRLPKSQVCTYVGVGFSGIQSHIISFLVASWSNI